MNVPNSMPELLYKKFSTKEEREARQWARDWYAKHGAFEEPKSVWHPVILDELRKINEENRP